MLKKSFVLVVICVSFLIFGCVSSPNNVPVNFVELESKNFVLTEVMFMTNIAEYSIRDPLLFKALPILEVINKIEAKYGIKIDTSLLNTETEILSYNLGMPNYLIKLDTEYSQQVEISFFSILSGEWVKNQYFF